MLQSPDLCSSKSASASYTEKLMPIFRWLSEVFHLPDMQPRFDNLGLTNLVETMRDEQTSQAYIPNSDSRLHAAAFRILTGSNDDDFLRETWFHLLRVTSHAAFSALGFAHIRVLGYWCKVGQFQVANSYSQTTTKNVVSYQSDEQVPTQLASGVTSHDIDKDYFDERFPTANDKTVSVPVSSDPATISLDSAPDSRFHSPSTKAPTITVPTAEKDAPLHSPPHLDHFKWFDNVVFELDDVLLQSPIHSKADKRTKGIRYDVMTTLAWSKFERGLIGLDECRVQLSASLELSDAEVADAVEKAMSWGISPELMALATELRSTHNLYAVGNLPGPVFDGLKESLRASNLFKRIFISAELNQRLPHPAVFTEALASAALYPKRSLYVGSHIDNLISARSFGFYSIECCDIKECIQRIRQLCREPIAGAKRWLKSRAGELDLETSLGITVKDAFMQSCILDATGDKSLIYFDPDQRRFSWFYGAVPHGLKQFPIDVDCNAIAYSAFDHLDDANRQSVMDQMLEYVDSQGILQGYLSEEKVRIDIVMCANGLALFNEYGRGHELAATENWLYNVLVHRAFRDGTHYYPSPDLFFYFVSRLLRKAPNNLRERFGPVLRDCVLERTEADGDALALACRVIAAARCGVRDERNLEKLLSLQMEDEGWEGGVTYRFNRTEGVAWHQGFTVSLAVLAIEEWDALRRGRNE